MERNRLLAIVVATLVVLGALYYRLSSSAPVDKQSEGLTMPIVQEPGSEHSHASIIMLVNGNVIDFNQARYVERSEYAHIHDNSPYFIHKHAKGVTLHYFLETIGVKITSDCIYLDNFQFCNKESAKLTILINRVKFNPEYLPYYEIKDGEFTALFVAKLEVI